MSKEGGLLGTLALAGLIGYSAVDDYRSKPERYFPRELPRMEATATASGDPELRSHLDKIKSYRDRLPKPDMESDRRWLEWNLKKLCNKWTDEDRFHRRASDIEDRIERTSFEHLLLEQISDAPSNIYFVKNGSVVSVRDVKESPQRIGEAYTLYEGGKAVINHRGKDVVDGKVVNFYVTFTARYDPEAMTWDPKGDKVIMTEEEWKSRQEAKRLRDIDATEAEARKLVKDPIGCIADWARGSGKE